MTLKDLFELCFARWDIKVNIIPNEENSGDKYNGCMAETPWYLLDKPIENWWINNDRTLEIVINET